ncbi:protein-L-isoaspartate O-methyltransferase family protein [Nitrospirillum iridis]|uniref:Protein-L-isoaspartate O-methyltransferase n=1 Tax=Nitrospirillum iridis TaxID=765888 RepID=A0A7X0AXX9_9PROT|nr:protein-L-isoaspartate O-methyltransferase [Nitrospirillum iridis]MBB6251351.1 protein-L-isoaspartate(D-aspartate) O-methyltransferase [Nitrospirillum iridis]
MAADYTAARVNMIEGQIRPNKVTDPFVVEAFLAIPRERFVPEALAGVAYVDEDVPVAPGRYLLEPMVLARLVQELSLTRADKVLAVGVATGYSAAIMAELAGSVVALESDPALVEAARKALSGVAGVTVVQGDLAAGHAAKAPYGAILVDGSVPEVPASLLDQLPEGGRLAAVVINAAGLGEARYYRKVGGVVSHRILFDAAVQPLPGFERRAEFVF